jgi:hypothetical protein
VFATVKEDRELTIKKAAIAAQHTQEYKDLKQEIEKLNQKLDDNSSKKSTVKTIGYTSATLGMISSAWAMYEKTLSLKNSKIELEIRNSIKIRVLQEIEVLKSLEQTETNTQQIHNTSNTHTHHTDPKSVVTRFPVKFVSFVTPVQSTHISEHPLCYPRSCWIQKLNTL